MAFAQGCDVITYEFENIPTAALDILEAHRPIRPGREALRISQDRLTEKTWLAGLGLAVAPFAPVEDAASLAEALERIGRPAILKTRRFGYDGKGQVRIDADIDAARGACRARRSARDPRGNGGLRARDLGHRLARARRPGGLLRPRREPPRCGILRETRVPADLPHPLMTDAVLIAARILNALDYVGVIGVELFVTEGGPLVNEIAPRVHNSGHWTQNGCLIDQFEQHVRAVAGWPLGDAERHSDIVMQNLIGDDVDRLSDLLAEPKAALHLYGKAETRPGRKMGHVNRRR